MRNLLTVILMSFIISCQNAENDNSFNTNLSNGVKPKEYNAIQHSYLRTDTMRFANDNTRFVVVGLQDVVVYNDSSKHVPMDVLYYIQNKQVSAYSDSLNSEGEEDLYLSFEGIDNNEVPCEHFFSVNFGFGACGYAQQHILFNATSSQCYYVTKHSSSADGLYGEGRKFYNMCLGQSTTQITSVEEIHEPDEKEQNLIISYSDSAVYTFDGKAWNTQLITEKEKIFRKEKEKI